MNFLYPLILPLFLTIPAIGASFPYITLSGTTNRIADNGSALTRNGSAIAGGGGTVGTLITNGAAIITGDIVAYGSALTNTAKATAANITNAWGIFTGSTTTFLNGNGALGTPSFTQTNVAAANPTATATSSIQNGTATTFMRSDASPALPQALSTASSPTFNLLSAADTLIGGISVSRGTLTHAAGNVIVDFSGTNRYWSCTITGNVTFVLTNAAAGKHANIFLLNSQATNCTPTFNFPASSTTNFYGGAPSTLTAGTFGSLSYFCIDATTNSTKAAYTETQ